MDVMKRSRTGTVLLLAMLIPSARLFAGPSIHAKPLPECRSFFITTFGYDYRVTKPLTIRYSYLGYDSTTYLSAYQISGRHMLSSELGIMHNLDPKYAVGFSQYLGWDVTNTLHGGLSLRGRRWLDQQKSIDLTVGALLWGAHNEGFDYPGFVGTASLNFNDWENVRLTVTALQARQVSATMSQQTEIGAFLGYQVGGKPGLILTAASVLATGLLFAIYFGTATYD